LAFFSNNPSRFGALRHQPNVRRLFTEFVVVVLGVAVALAADSWRKGLTERASESEYSQRLVAELNDGLKSIDRNHNRVVRAVAAIDTLLSLRTPFDSTALVRLAVRAADYEYNPAGILHDLTYRELFHW
jgi:hypothetical protein